MITTLNEGTRKARKQHRCWHCYRPIAKGTEYGFATFKYDYVYTLKYHIDCQKAAWWHFARSRYCPDNDGYPPLADDIHGGDGQHDIDALRGFFPHVACRLEFSSQKVTQ